MNNDKLTTAINRTTDRLYDAHQDYINGLKQALASIERELKVHTEAEAPLMPSTSGAGTLMCGDLRQAQQASDEMSKLSEQLRLLQHLVD